MYYPSSENKGADQLRGYREADLRLCFRLCKLLVFSCTGSHMLQPYSGLCQRITSRINTVSMFASDSILHQQIQDMQGRRLECKFKFMKISVTEFHKVGTLIDFLLSGPILLQVQLLHSITISGII